MSNDLDKAQIEARARELLAQYENPYAALTRAIREALTQQWRAFIEPIVREAHDELTMIDDDPSAAEMTAAFNAAMLAKGVPEAYQTDSIAPGDDPVEGFVHMIMEQIVPTPRTADMPAWCEAYGFDGIEAAEKPKAARGQKAKGTDADLKAAGLKPKTKDELRAERQELVAQAFVDFRNVVGIDMVDFAKRLGAARTTINNWFNAKTQPKVDIEQCRLMAAECDERAALARRAADAFTRAVSLME